MQIARALRKIHPDENAAVKRISRTTGIEIRTTEKWFQARKVLNTKYLLMLMLHYPEVREVFHDLISPPISQPVTNNEKITISDHQNQDYEKHFLRIYRIISDPVNPAYDARKVSDLNLCQLWFLSEIAVGSNPNSGSIQHKWRVSLETTKRDISKLKRYGLIQFSNFQLSYPHSELIEFGQILPISLLSEYL